MAYIILHYMSRIVHCCTNFECSMTYKGVCVACRMRFVLYGRDADRFVIISKNTIVPIIIMHLRCSSEGP